MPSTSYLKRRSAVYYAQLAVPLDVQAAIGRAVLLKSLETRELRVASDHPIYVRWSLMHGTVHPSFEWRARGPEDWRVRPADGFPTRYEEKAVAAGRPPAYLRFVRRPR